MKKSELTVGDLCVIHKLGISKVVFINENFITVKQLFTQSTPYKPFIYCSKADEKKGYIEGCFGFAFPRSNDDLLFIEPFVEKNTTQVKDEE